MRRLGELGIEWARALHLLAWVVALCACCSLLAALLVKPSWNAPGWPSFVGYGKNVEHAAVALSFAAVAAFILFRGQRSYYSFAGVVLVSLGGAIAYRYLGSPRSFWGLLGLLAAGAVYFAWYDAYRDRDRIAAPPRQRWYRWGVAGLLILVALGLVASISVWRRGSHIDFHHQGEIVTSARDFLQGGTPFRTFFWPHGLGETGITALLMLFTGNEGLGAVKAYHAVAALLGCLTIALIALQLGRQALLTGLSLVVITLDTGRVLHLCRTAFISLVPVIAFLVLVRAERWTTHVVAGALLGFGYLWRVDSGVFGVAVAAAYLFIKVYYAEGYARDGRIIPHLLDRRRLQRLLKCAAALALGIGLTLLASRLVLGFPTHEWFSTTLIDLPRYHADSTGAPFLHLLNGGEKEFWGDGYPQASKLAVLGYLLLMVGLTAFTLRKAWERRLPLDTPRERFFLLMLIYSLLFLKTAFHRSDTGHLAVSVTIPLLLVAYDWLGRMVERAGGPRGLAAACLAPLAVTVAFCAMTGAPPRLPTLGFLERQPLVLDCLRPTQTWQELLQPARGAKKREIVAAIAELRSLLDQHDVGERELLVYHSAPLLYPLLGRELPTKYYCLGWAVTERRQRELIGELERNHVRAFLQVNAFGGGMPFYDVPDSHRIPVVAGYIAAREAQGTSHETKLGRLTIITPSEVASHDRRAAP